MQIILIIMIVIKIASSILPLFLLLTLLSFHLNFLSLVRTFLYLAFLCTSLHLIFFPCTFLLLLSSLYTFLLLFSLCTFLRPLIGPPILLRPPLHLLLRSLLLPLLLSLLLFLSLLLPLFLLLLCVFLLTFYLCASLLFLLFLLGNLLPALWTLGRRRVRPGRAPAWVWLTRVLFCLFLCLLLLRAGVVWGGD